jgi:hypothetical protein
MRIITLILWVYASLYQAVYAQSTKATQDYVFKVLASSGSNSVARGVSTTDWQLLRTGQKVTKDDKIKLSPNSFLALVHENGRSLELKTPGTFTVSELDAKLSSAKATFNDKYLKLIFEEITKVEKEDVNKNRHSNMGIEGKVERGHVDLVALLPASQPLTVFSDQILLKWKKLPGSTTYKISVVDMFDEVLYSATVSDTVYTLDLSQPTLRKENTFLISISSVDKPNASYNKYSINRLSTSEAVALNKKLAELKEGKEETSISRLVQASFFEENKLLLDAMKAYEEAIKLQPDVADYRLVYNRFLNRNNFTKE